MSDEREASGLNDLEAALGSLAPRPPALNRDAVMFRAGRAAARRWQWATLFSSSIAAALAVALVMRPATDRAVDVPLASTPPTPAESVPETPADPPPSPEGSEVAAYYRLQEQVAERGLDALPPLPAEPGPSAKFDPFSGS